METKKLVWVAMARSWSKMEVGVGSGQEFLKPASPLPRHPHGAYGHYHRWHWHNLLLQHWSIPPELETTKLVWCLKLGGDGKVFCARMIDVLLCLPHRS
jgi:hypothetical protein